MKGLDSSCVKIHKKIIKIFKWIIEYQNDAQNVLGPFVPYIQIYVEKVMDSSKEIDVIDTAKRFLSVDLQRINNTSKWYIFTLMYLIYILIALIIGIIVYCVVLFVTDKKDSKENVITYYKEEIYELA